MNWTRFQTYEIAPEKAFEMLCNQLFENWCKSEYATRLAYFNVANGAGGDGGVESYATLSNGDIIGLQAKWFLNTIDAPQIAQVKKSFETAIKVRPNIVRYVVCVPRDLASKTARGGKAEDEKWNGLIAGLKAEYPNTLIELWNDFRITKELQKEESAGTHRFWFENAELSEECFSLAMGKAMQSWLSKKYVPNLNVPGEINNTLDKFLGSYEHRKSLANTLSKINRLSGDFEKATDELLLVCRDRFEKLSEIINEARDRIKALKSSCHSFQEWINNDSSSTPNIQENIFHTNFQSVVNNIDNYNFPSYGIPTYKVVKILEKLAKIDFYQLYSDLDDCLNKQNLLFLGNPGTGKTQGAGAFAQKIHSEKLHLPILVQARSVDSNQTWRDILIRNLGLSDKWNECKLWQALVATVNRHKFNSNIIDACIKITPKILIIVDGIDESSDTGKWIERIQETAAITEAYPQIKFCFTSRPAAITADLNDNVLTISLNPGGDVPTFKLFDNYMKAYNITATNSGWLKYAITTPLALKLFCELNRNRTVEISNKYEVSMDQLWKKKIEYIEEELERKEDLPARNQYVFHSIVFLAEYYIDHEFIEQSELISALNRKLKLGQTHIQSLISHFELCGILWRDRVKGSGLSPDKCNYYPDIQGYFDYAIALTLIEKYEHPQNINFEECSAISVNTLYGLAFLSIQKYKYLLTRNNTIDKVVDSSTLMALYYVALQHSDHDTAQQFVKQTREFMNESADTLISTVNNLVLPLSRDVNHPLGVPLLNDFLSEFKFPAQRDILWSLPEHLHDSNGKRWYKTQSLALDKEEYFMTEHDTHNGLPTVYAWALSTVNNALRKAYRNSLMSWSQRKPQEYLKLFLNFASVNDPQIRSDLFSILMCLAYDTTDNELIKTVSEWVRTNILAPEKIDEIRDVSIRYYSIAIIERAKTLDIISCEEAEKYLPPYIIANNYQISLNKDALEGAGVVGYSAIDYDLSICVLIDHFENRFYSLRESNQFSKMIKLIIGDSSGYTNITHEQFIISAAYAFILNMGWNEEDFYYVKDKNGKAINGVDCSINKSYPRPAIYIGINRVMTVCEKYVWQARNYISGFLSDRLFFEKENVRLADYGKLDNFPIPAQEMTQIDPFDIPEDNPWHIPEPTAVIIDGEHDSKDDVITSVLSAPEVDWEKWIIFKNEQKEYSVSAEELLVLSSKSCFTGTADVETWLSINSIIIESDQLPLFINQLKTNKKLPGQIFQPNNWLGRIEPSCTPKEICWFPWKKRYDSDNVDEFPEYEIQSAVDECYHYSSEYGSVYWLFPSAPIRKLLGIIDSDGYLYSDKNKVVRAKYCISGEIWGAKQNNLIVDKNLLLEKLTAENKALVWMMEALRLATSITKEKYGEFYAKKTSNYIGYLKNGCIVSELINLEKESQTEEPKTCNIF
jgi:hypothetical protein